MNRLTDPFRPREARSDAAGVWAPALVLVALGLVSLYSVGPRHVPRQAAWALLGLVACLAASRLPSTLVRRAAGPFLGLTGLLLLAALLFAPKIAETRRWLPIPLFGVFQPSELAKLAVVVFLADRLAHVGHECTQLWRTVWPVAPICLLIVLAPDFGTTVFVGTIAAVMLLVAGVKLGRLLLGGVLALPVLLLVAMHFPYVAERLRFFRGERSYQLEQAEIALASGGFLGKGWGAGRQKFGYLPAGHTDFILPNVGEELGFLGVGLVAFLFAMILVHGLRIGLAAAKRRDAFGFHLAFGATLLVVFQAALNIAVSTGAAPTKGISLPFLSQGGSNLLVSLAAVGLVLGVGRAQARQEAT
ncbi:MAG: FtsW/RodA/SpoVE family cell cycle protein [Planctomycetaceae bacterium]